MKLTNRTDAHAKLLKNASPSGPRAMMGCVVAREVFTVGDDGALVPAAGRQWPIDPEEVATPLGTLPGDRPFLLGGVDVLLGGLDDGARGLASRLARAWTSTARTGRPAHDDLPWPAYDLDTRRTCVLDRRSEVVSDPEAEIRQMWVELRAAGLLPAP